MVRRFSEIVALAKEGNPITQPQPYAYGAGGSRRSRTFSQVLAQASMGNPDAGMAMRSGGKAGPNGPTTETRQRPDWRGHFLGKGDVGLYVRRNLENAQDLHNWAAGTGIPNLVPPEEMHVTQVYSREPLRLNVKGGQIESSGGPRSLAPLGDKGAVVLHFQSEALQRRFSFARGAGASWDHDGSYKPHVTLTYDAGGVDISAIEPPTFPLIFGPEIHEPLNENWAEDKGLRKRAFDFLAALNASRFAKARVWP